MIQSIPKISIAIPTHDMENGDYFLSRLINSLNIQTFRDFEVVITKRGGMAKNSNEAIKRCRGGIIKVLYQDDYLGHENALKEIAEAFKGGWLVTGCEHDTGNGVRMAPHFPKFSPSDVNNFIGSPSVLAFENNNPLLFDENMTWLLDLELYKRLYARYGPPTILNTLNAVIGIGSHQVTNQLSDEHKLREVEYLNNKKHE